jgi:hypothetical protein
MVERTNEVQSPFRLLAPGSYRSYGARDVNLNPHQRRGDLYRHRHRRVFGRMVGCILNTYRRSNLALMRL